MKIDSFVATDILQGGKIYRTIVQTGLLWIAISIKIYLFARGKLNFHFTVFLICLEKTHMLISQFGKSTLFCVLKSFPDTRYVNIRFTLNFLSFFFFFSDASNALNVQTESISNYSKLSPTWKITSLTR